MMSHTLRYRLTGSCGVSNASATSLASHAVKAACAASHSSRDKMAGEHRLNIKFVQEVEKYPYLYNYKLPEYVRKDLTEQAWGEIGKKFRLSGSECKEKWKNLRCVFVRHLKPPRPGSIAIKKPYYLAEFMQFALPYVKLQKNKELSSDTSFNDDHLLPRTILPDEESEDQSTEDFFPASPLRLSPIELPAENASNSLSNKKPMHKCKDANVDQVIAAYFKMKQAKIIANGNNDASSNRMFLLSILPDMNKMNDKKKRIFKRRLLDLVDEVIDEDSD